MAQSPTSEVSSLASQISVAALRHEATRLIVHGLISDRSEGSSTATTPPPLSQLDRGHNLSAVAAAINAIADSL